MNEWAPTFRRPQVSISPSSWTWSYSLCIFLRSPVTSTLLIPTTLPHRILWHPQPMFSLNMRDQVSHSHHRATRTSYVVVRSTGNLIRWQDTSCCAAPIYPGNVVTVVEQRRALPLALWRHSVLNKMKRNVLVDWLLGHLEPCRETRRCVGKRRSLRRNKEL
jgi:hypothetical protein